MPRLVRVEERIQPERAARTVAIAASAVTTHVGKSAMSCMLKMFCKRRWSMLRRARARAGGREGRGARRVEHAHAHKSGVSTRRAGAERKEEATQAKAQSRVGREVFTAGKKEKKERRTLA